MAQQQLTHKNIFLKFYNKNYLSKKISHFGDGNFLFLVRFPWAFPAVRKFLVKRGRLQKLVTPAGSQTDPEHAHK